MPLSHPDTRERLRSGACTECMFSVGATVTIAGTTHGWCLNHLVPMLHPLLAAAQRAPESLAEGECVACGRAARVVHVEDGQWNGALCPGHALAYLAHSLSPPAFRRILAEARADQNEIFALHDDFYTADGNAWQPGAVSLPSLRARIKELPTLPELDEAGDYAWPPALLAELMELAREDYRAWSGLDEVLTDFLARTLVEEHVMVESFRRNGAFQDRPRTDAGIQAVRAALEPLLAATIPAAADPFTCRRLSGWMSERISTGQHPQDIARSLALGLRAGQLTVDEACVAAAADHIHREILPLLGKEEPCG